MVLWTLAVGFILIIWLFKLNKDFYILALFAPRIKNVDGSSTENIAPTLPGTTIFGNTFDVVGLDFVGTFRYARECAARMKRSYIQHFAGKTVLNIIDPELTEMVVTDTRLITKGFVYNFLKPALGEGLLISTDKKWHNRRKMLTPAFHFNILGQFEEIFKEESQKFVKELENLDTDIISLDEVIPKLTLNVVCETALGVKLDECLNGDEYRESFQVFEECFNKRVNSPHLMVESIYKAFEEKKYLPSLKIAHDFSSDIIEKRRQLFAEELDKQQEHSETKENEEFGFKKKRYAMLDTLLKAEKEGLIDHAGICEEVDTFMFEGFDTTSMGLIFSLMNLSLNPDMQELCYKEIMENIDDVKDLDISQLSKLKYMECFLKETMRLYPSVPVIMREAVKETQLPNGLIIPAKSFITIHIFDLHRNPKYFENPSKFDPDRFTPENSAGRHPYAYLPFSGGQRNCIETALGVKLDECLNGDEYRESFQVFEECFNKRVNSPHLMVESIYKAFEEKKYLPSLKIAHDFSSDIIEKRRQLFAKELDKQQEHSETTENEEFGFKKKRYAMLDTLLKAEKEGLIDHAGICEEVDTFMFEGFDTTSMGLIFSLMNLSLNPDMQELCYKEIMENIDDVKELDISQLSKLKYMECFLKETMRLYPSVPVIMREAVKETQLPNGLIIPAKSFITIHIFDLHRNPKYFENPSKFDPDRFTPENSAGRHPYAYLPFSGGQRNCIGQKFAMLEMKTLLVNFITKFKLLPMVDPDKFEFKQGIIIRTKDEVKVKLVKRQ